MTVQTTSCQGGGRDREYGKVRLVVKLNTVGPWHVSTARVVRMAWGLCGETGTRNASLGRDYPNLPCIPANSHCRVFPCAHVLQREHRSTLREVPEGWSLREGSPPHPPIHKSCPQWTKFRFEMPPCHRWTPSYKQVAGFAVFTETHLQS
jgi:hypothetical protein